MAMQQETTYEFEQVPVVMPNGQRLYASGAFNVSYQIYPPERDVGIFSAYPEFDPTDDFVTLTAFDADSDEHADMTITLPWLPNVRPCPDDPLGQIWESCRDHISEHIMEIEDDD